MTEAEIRSAVFEQLGEIAPDVEPDAIPGDANLREEAELDSYDFLQLIVRLHKSLGVEIPEDDYPRLATLDGMIGYLAEKLP